jgi:hypothetical protein
MKKGMFLALMILIASSLFSQSIEYFGTDDVWSFNNADGVEIYDDSIVMYFSLDMYKTNWQGYNPKKEGLLGVKIAITIPRNDKGVANFIFAYNSLYDIQISNWVLIYNQANNAYLFGGQATNGDRVHIETLNDGTYITATDINLTTDWVNWFIDNPGGFYRIAIIEYSYGDNLIFTLPESLFRKINEIYYSIENNNDNS